MSCCAIILVILLALLIIYSSISSSTKEGFNNYADILQANSLKKMKQWNQNHTNYKLSTLDESEPNQALFDPIRPILAFPATLDSGDSGDSNYRNSRCI